MTTTSKRTQLEEDAARVGLYLDTYSPGDGVTRYRFFTEPGADYFGGASRVTTVLGLKDARTFVDAWALARRATEDAR